MRKLVFKDKPTNRETASVDRYLKEIAKYKILSPDAETKYAKLSKTGDQSARDMLINCNLRFVVSVAKQYENLGLSLLELINEGNIGLVKAVSKFDETRGFKLITYAVWWIRREILLAINQQSEYKYFSLDKELHEGELTLLDSLMSKDYYNLQNDLKKASLKQEIERSLKTIPPSEAEILRLHFGLQPEMTFGEMSEYFEIPLEKVYEKKNLALERLRNSKNTKVLKSYLT